VPKTDTARARLPRGTKPVIQAFFEALDAIPESLRADVATAAHARIRDEIKAQREKAKLAKTKARGRAAAAQVPKAGKASKGAKATRSIRGAAKPASARTLKPGRGAAAKAVTSGRPRGNARAKPAARRSRIARETQNDPKQKGQNDPKQNGENHEVQTPAASA
jgi:hypothetical protein